MTCREMFVLDYPDSGDPAALEVCPDDFGYAPRDPYFCDISKPYSDWKCKECWDRAAHE